MFADIVLPALPFKLFTQRGGAAALPHNGIVDGAAGFLIPYDGGFTLIGDADGGNFFGRYVAFGQYLHHHAVLGRINFHRIVFHIAGLGVVLGELFLSHGDDILLAIE